MTTKLRVAVLMGGNSNEKEISLDSGRNIFYKLSGNKYQTTPVFVTGQMHLYQISSAQLVYNSTKEIEQSLSPDQRIGWSDLSSLFDFVFIGLHGGFGENGAVQGALEMLGIPYNGSSVLASALCMDKFKTTQFLQSQGFQVPQSLLVSAQQWKANPEIVINTIMTTFKLPCIIKPHDDGCSVMVHKITHQDQLAPCLEAMFASKTHAMVEEFVGGMELTVGVYGNDTVQALPPSQAIATAGILSIEEKFLPGAGENQTPAPLPQEALTLVQKTMERVFQTVGCRGYARIDCFYQTAQQSPTGQERVVILEINSLPGMTAATCLFHQAAEVGMRPHEFIELIIQLGLQEHGKETGIVHKAPLTVENTPII